MKTSENLRVKNEKYANAKGITLISLIITIIVMLILIAVTVNVLIESGIIGSAKNAANKTETAYEDEAGLNKVTIGGKEFDSIEDYIADNKKDNNPGVLETIGTDRYEINSIEDLVALSYSVNKGETTYLGKTIELGKSLDFADDASYTNPESKYIFESSVGYKLSEEGTSIKELLLGDSGFIPVGAFGSSTSKSFYGTIEGNSRTISNMKVTTVSSNGGLIGVTQTGQDTIINNLGMEESNIRTNAPAGGIIGQVNGTVTINNCYNTGTVHSSAMAGGLVGSNSSGTTNIYNSFNSADVSSSSGTGGIIANSNGTTTNCYNIGDVTGGGAPTGGVYGYGSGTIANCYNAGTVTSTTSSTLIGGVAGVGGATITNCYFKEGSAPVGIGNSGTGEATSKTEAQMQTDTFLEALKGSTANTAWKRVNGVNNGMPILSWQ